ncbi:YceI family protein [Psychroserpens sp. SPM9]|uniref:YceI family protein n=1 Tax=Psychroserpens sp. SPM9 TaxID=2975598 RepID=UPI0021A70533|nr:YceI family protein [Psychroserpens sp. SPM9]MDG5492118.1 YceI family protein [Psychroserpens sp. SPM9]
MRPILYFFLLMWFNVSAQTKYLTKTGTVSFEASVPAFEEVAAKSNSVTAIINLENGEFAALVLVKSFRFKNALMEEHFNENYAESDQFPKATFKGKLKNFNFDNTKSSYTIDGELTFHGKTKTMKTIVISFKTNDNLITIIGEFSVKASDFNIEIPKIVSQKISEDIQVQFQFELQKKN